MGFFLGVIGLLLIVKGVAAIMAPKKFANFFLRLLSEKDPKNLALIPLCIGILLLFAASSSAAGWIVVLVALAEISKAVYLFITPAEKIKNARYFKSSDNSRRAIGIFMLILGVMIFISRQ